MPLATMTTILPFLMTPRRRQEKVTQLIALLKLRLSRKEDHTKVLRELRGHDSITVEFTFLMELEDLDAARIEARAAHEDAKQGNDLEDEVQTRVAIYAADSAYAQSALAYDTYRFETSE